MRSNVNKICKKKPFLGPYFCLFWKEALFSQWMSADAKYPFPVSKKHMFWKAYQTIKGSSQKSLGEETLQNNQNGNSTFILLFTKR